MFLDQATKSFLLEVLATPPNLIREDSSVPTTGRGNTGADWIWNPGGTAWLMDPSGRYDRDWYQKWLKSSVGGLGGTFDPSSYSGGPSLSTLGALGIMKRAMGYGAKGNRETELLGNRDLSTASGLAKTFLTTAGKLGLATAALTPMGPIGAGLAKKLPYLTTLGVDPFDYATQVMGVDYVADQLSKLGPRQRQQITSGAGYIKL